MRFLALTRSSWCALVCSSDTATKMIEDSMTHDPIRRDTMRFRDAVAGPDQLIALKTTRPRAAKSGVHS